MKRRNIIIGAGALASTGLSAGFFASTAGAQSSARIQSRDAAVSNDRGNVSLVTIDPEFTVNWNNFDDAVGKVFWLVEAKVEGGDWQPLYRATPWLGPDDIGTTGSVKFDQFSSRLGRSLVVADGDGVPDYQNANWSSYGPASLSSYLDGTSMGSASDAQSLNLTLQNNFPSENAGYYGAAASTLPYPSNPFDESSDGQSSSTTVQLRYTIELQRPNLSQIKYILSNAPYRRYDPGQGATLDQYVEAINKASSTQFELMKSDVDTGNSRIVMSGEDGYPGFSGYANGAGIPYNVLRNNAGDHPGIILSQSQFTVTATNEPSNSNTGSSGSSGTGAS